jgi:hypothetical protein
LKVLHTFGCHGRVPFFARVFARDIRCPQTSSRLR